MKTLLLIVAVLLLETYQQTAHADEIMPNDTSNEEKNAGEHEDSGAVEGSGSDEGSERNDDTEDDKSVQEEGSGSDEGSEGKDDTEDDKSVQEEGRGSDEHSAEDKDSVDEDDNDSDTGEGSEEIEGSSETGKKDDKTEEVEDSGSDQSTKSKESKSHKHNSHHCKHECWTAWFDNDDPTALGDSETLEELYHKYPGMICNRPLDIQVKTTSGHNVSSTGDVIAASDTRNGFVCKNSDQLEGSECHDYKVRFRCPQKFCHPKVCWTKWFSRDSACGSGDWELLCALRAEHPGQICARPLHIEVQKKLNDVPAVFSGHTFYSPTESCACHKCDQRKHEHHDYKVRFGCPCDV